MFFFTPFKRILGFGWIAFTRNQGLNFEVIFIMIIAILTLSFLFIFNDLSNFLITKFQEKVDIAVYFNKGIEEKEVLQIKEELYKNFSEKIKSINYISEKEAKEVFLLKHEKDIYFQALKEIGINPLLASLEIKAQDPIFYHEISEFLEKNFKNFLWKISYIETQEIINKISNLSLAIKKAGIVFEIILAFLVFFITFNTIKLTISVLREEITTMRLVGASNWFIRGPFFIQSFLYGIFSVLIVNLLFLGGFYYFGTFHLEGLLGFDLFLGFNFLENFKENFSTIFLYQIGFIFLLSFSASFFAIQRYLKI